MKIYCEQNEKYSPNIFYYAFAFAFDWDVVGFCKKLKDKHGWHKITFFDGLWRIADLEVIRDIINRYDDLVSVDSNIKILLGEEEKKELREFEPIEISGIKGELYPYQKDAVNFLFNSGGRAVLSSDMGLGKSLMALSYVTTSKLTKILIICPASLKWNWGAEIKKFTNLSYFVVNSKEGLAEDDYNKNDVIIINYDILGKFFDILCKLKFDICICDEAHFLKSQSQRFGYTKLIVENIPKILLLTGTFILNKTIDAFNLLHLVKPQVWNSRWRFGLRYADLHKEFFGWNWDGSSHLDELRDKIQGYFLRQKKEDVLKQLPKKRFINYFVEMDIKWTSIYNKAVNDFCTYLKDIKKKTKEQIEKSVQAEKLVKLNELRQILSAGKIDSAKELIEKIVLDYGEKVVVFSVYNDPLVKMSEYFGEMCVMLTGKSSEKEKENAVKQFQENEDVKIFLGGMLSASVGLNLTAASNVILLDFPWRPADINQAYSRIDRIGQKSDSINIYQIVVKSSLDEHIIDILAEKQKVFDELMGEGEGTSGTNLIKELIAKLSTG